MDDEFKQIKFRNEGRVYTAHAVDLSDRNANVSGNFLMWTAAFRIYDEENEKLIGKICFQQSTLLDYLWADPNKKRFPPKEYLEEALVNLLHYLPFDKETLIPEGDSFIFRFIRDLEDGRQKDARIYNIKVEDSMEKTYHKKIFGAQITDEKIAKAILEPLYMQWLNNYTTNLTINLLSSILPFDQNTIGSRLELLEYNKFIDILRETTGAFVSVKIRPEGVEFLAGVSLRGTEPKVKMVKNVQIGHKFNIKTGNNSPVNIHSDIDTSFDSIRKEIEEKNPANKEEILKDLGSLQDEIKAPKDINTIKTLLGKIGKAADWVGRRVEPIVQQVVASYISSQLPLPPIK
ncbi:MAG: hypothetical protein Q7S79_02875 [bacterium]|nr:hypothetical protein [bacterium]